MLLLDDIRITWTPSCYASVSIPVTNESCYANDVRNVGNGNEGQLDGKLK